MSMWSHFAPPVEEGQAKYRHEYKFMCSETEWTVLRARIGAFMERDSHAGEEGFYEIRSIYFDDIYNTCYYKNEAGVDPRAKYRIRCYNCSDGKICLEKKIKESGKTNKKSCLLTKEQFSKLCAGHYPELLHTLMKEREPDRLLMEFVTLGLTRRMQPKVIVSYERYPYVEKMGNVRVTFDKNIASSVAFSQFFDKNPVRMPVLPKGQHLLEVKYDEFLPGYIKEALEDGRLQQTTFSKYYICRHERIRR